MWSPSDQIRLFSLIMMATLLAGAMGCASPVATQQPVSPKVGMLSSDELKRMPKASIVVFPFSSNVADFPDQRGQFPDREALQSACESRIGKCPFFYLLTRDNLNAVLAEQRFQQSDLWSGDSTKIYEVGRALGADHVLVGRFVGGKLNYGWLRNFSLSLKLVDINELRSTTGYALFDLGTTSYTQYEYIPQEPKWVPISNPYGRGGANGYWQNQRPIQRAVGRMDGAFERNFDLQTLVNSAVSDLIDNYVTAAQRAYEASHASEAENPSQAIKQ